MSALHIVARISRVYLWPNRMVMVFDQFGHQMPEYQGFVVDVRERLAEAGWPENLWVREDWKVLPR